MSAFDKIIGYETIKTELYQICDIVKNRDVYHRIGAKLPRGVLLYGNPGLGKSLMAKCMIEERGLTTYTIRKTMGGPDFLRIITETFETAKEHAPSIVFLDDMDKFANEDDWHVDAEEYVAVQACIDDVKDYEVFVFATSNDIDKLPESLVRTGRFDRKIHVLRPTAEDARAIIAHYLSDKKLAADVNLDDVGKMMSYGSCAELETILNEAAINAAYNRNDEIGMSDMVNAVLRLKYHTPDKLSTTPLDEKRRIALHEAGHAVISEVLSPGSVGLVSVRSKGRDAIGGFTHSCKVLNRRQDVIVSLGGKASVEMYYTETCAGGCAYDIKSAVDLLRDGMEDSATNGFALVHITYNESEALISRREIVIQAELERYMLKARDILLKNRSFLEHMTEELTEKETLLYSDIQRIRDAEQIVAVAV